MLTAYAVAQFTADQFQVGLGLFVIQRSVRVGAGSCAICSLTCSIVNAHDIYCAAIAGVTQLALFGASFNSTEPAAVENSNRVIDHVASFIAVL
jgi:hypothetical protein